MIDKGVFGRALRVVFLAVGRELGLVFFFRLGGQDQAVAVSPWVIAFRADFAFPSGVTGPWDLAPLALAAARRAAEIDVGFRNLWDIFSSRFKDKSHFFSVLICHPLSY